MNQFEINCEEERMKIKYFACFLFILIIAVVAYASTHWHYDDPRWDSEIPNWWDEENFQPPRGPLSENSKSFWNEKAQKLLNQKINKKLNLNKAKNIVIMIGDGMGLSSQMATRSYLRDPSEELSFEKFPYSGLSKVYCVNYQVPDSASTATAIFSGIKNNFMVLSLTADVNLRNCSASKNESSQIESIFKYAQDSGKSTGIVTTTRLTHATPAAAYAKSASRQWEGNEGVPEGCDDIAHQLIHGKIGENLDVMLGGGSRYFFPTSDGGRRTDNRNLVIEYLMKTRQQGKVPAIAYNRRQLNEIRPKFTDKILGLFASSHLDYKLLANNDLQPTLTEMTSKALEMLNKNENGFVLLIEGGRIDTSHHENRAKLALEEVVEFHKAVEFVRENTNEEETLIVVTADHSHPFTVGGYLPRFRNVLGVGDFSIEDKMWIFSTSYAQGQGHLDHNEEGSDKRKNPRGMNYMDNNFRQPATVPMDEGTHSGEDVGVYANGPYSHLFTGVYEQNYIAHAMMYASCLGPQEFLKNPNCKIEN